MAIKAKREYFNEIRLNSKVPHSLRFNVCKHFLYDYFKNDYNIEDIKNCFRESIVPSLKTLNRRGFSRKIVTLMTLLISFVPCLYASELPPRGNGVMNLEVGSLISQNHLTSIVKSQNFLRIKIDGGMKIDFPLSKLDVIYYQGSLNGSIEGHYRRLGINTWSRRYAFSIFYLDPNLDLVLTDIKIDQLALNEQSLRPQASVDLGLNLAVAQRFAVVFNTRYEHTWLDKELTTDGKSVVITGSQAYASLGLSAYF